MKILKKALVALLTISLLLSCLVLFAHAEDHKLDGEIEDVLEYYTFRNYMEEDFSNYVVDAPYSYAPFPCPECGGLLTATRPGKNKYQYTCNNAALGECEFEATSRNTLSPEVKFAPHGVDSRFNPTGVTTTVRAENGNSYLEIINCEGGTKAPIYYAITPMIEGEDGELIDHYTDSTIISFRIKTSNYVFYDSSINTGTMVPPAGVIEPESLNNGSNFMIQPNIDYTFVARTGDKAGETFTKTLTDTLFAMNCNDNTNPVFTYLEYDANWSFETSIYVQKTMDIKPKLDTWYTVDIVMDYQNDTYSLVVTPEGDEPVRVDNIAIDGFNKTTSLELAISDGVQTGTVTCLDDIAVYDGTFIRHGVDVDKETSDSIIALDALAKAETTSIADKVRIADVFDLLFNTDIDGKGGVYYTTSATTPNKDKVDAIIAEAKTTYINKTYQDALLAYASAIPTIEGYYNRVDHVENNLARFDELFSDEIFSGADPEAIKAQFPGITDVAAIRTAKAAYDSELVSIARARAHSEAFVELMKDFDPQNKSYKYMTEYLDALRVFDERDSTYKYKISTFVPGTDKDGKEIMIENIRYSTVADAEADLTALVNKLAEIETTANTFIAAAKEVKSAESFKTVYENYLVASDIYSDEIIHEALDDKTYPGLVEAISDYLACMDQVYVSMDESQAFIDIVTKAATKTYYVTILEELDKAVPYIDENVDELYAEPDYPGVAEAKAEYARLRELLASYVTSAEAYIAAVNAIAGADGFAAKKAAVEAALALKDKGDVIGIVGISEANKALATAESEIKVLEGNSAALKNAVLALKDAKTLAERRELIFIANSVKDNTEASIDGVSAAKAELETYVTQYNADVEALNSAFKGAVEGANAVAASAAPTAKAYITFDVIKLLLK